MKARSKFDKMALFAPLHYRGEWGELAPGVNWHPPPTAELRHETKNPKYTN